MGKDLKEYVQSDMVFRADLPQLLKETIECSPKGIYPLCWKLVGEILEYVAQRCIEVNDPQLNILMISLEDLQKKADWRAIRKIRFIMIMTT